MLEIENHVDLCNLENKGEKNLHASTSDVLCA